MSFVEAMLKGHRILRGTGNRTVIHNRNIGVLHGSGQEYMVLTEATTLCTVSNKDANQFDITCVGEWEALMILFTPTEADVDPWVIP